MEKNYFENVPGPSPWFFVDGKEMELFGRRYRWKNKSTPPGVTYLLHGKDVVLILDFKCYFQVLNEDHCLIWHDGEYIQLHQVCLSKLRPIRNSDKEAERIRKAKSHIGYDTDSERRLFIEVPHKPAGYHDCKELEQFHIETEILVIADYFEEGKNSNYFDQMVKAIYAFDFGRCKVQVYPQTWYNEGAFDFGYQWIAQVKRGNNGEISGTGVRIGDFDLDETNMNLKEKEVSNIQFNRT